jgi:hypothetical protein
MRHALSLGLAVFFRSRGVQMKGRGIEMSHSALCGVLAAAAILCVPTVGHCEEGGPGRYWYLNYCASCHGTSGKGDGSVAKVLPFRWRGNLAHMLPAKGKMRRVRHHPSHALSRAAGGNEKTAGAKQRQRDGEQAQNSRIIAERPRSPLGHSRRFLRVRQDYPTKLTVKVDLPDCQPWAKNWRLGGGVPVVWSQGPHPDAQAKRRVIA